MKLLDLFSGIGGFSLAASWVWGTDLDIVGFCEIDKFCQLKLNEIFPGVPIYDDIKKLKGKKFGTIELITGGDPCQPHSLTGKRKGKKDNRYLWPEMFRIIQETGPDWIINENVVGSISNGIVDQKCDDLESENYSCQTYNIPAVAVGAPHKRERIWIIANNEKKSNWKHHSQKDERQIQQSGDSIKSGNVFTNSKCDNAHSRPGEGRYYKSKKQPVHKEIKNNKRRIRSEIIRFDSTHWYEIASKFCRVDDGLPNRIHRNQALGNAIVPQVAAVIMSAIKETEKQS